MITSGEMSPTSNGIGYAYQTEVQIESPPFLGKSEPLGVNRKHHPHQEEGLHESYLSYSVKLPLALETTVQELTLYDISLESDCPGEEVAKLFEANPLLPGIIVTEKGQFVGMISRRRFFEYTGRPHNWELFLKCQLLVLYRFTQTDILILDGDTPIVVAVRQSLQRLPELVHEPIVVKTQVGTYQVLDVQQLLLAQLQVHELTTVVMRESEAQLRHQAQQLEHALHELQCTQTQLIQTEKMSSLGQLVAGIAHEINNPISFIYGNLPFAGEYVSSLLRMVTLYQKYYPNPVEEIKAEAEDIELEYLISDLPKLFSSMHQGAERIRQIVLSLRNFCRLDESQMKPVDIHDGINNTLLILQSQLKGKPGYPSIQVHQEYSDLPPVECYAGQLNQVFMNILVNAIDALHGRVSRRFQEEGCPRELEAKLPTICIQTELVAENQIAIRISDNGPGMTPDIQMRLFDPFFTTKPVGKGTGLGLSISYEIIVNQHSGELKCTSSPGEGAEFIIKIPIQQPRPPQVLPRIV